MSSCSSTTRSPSTVSTLRLPVSYCHTRSATITSPSATSPLRPAHTPHIARQRTPYSPTRGAAAITACVPPIPSACVTAIRSAPPSPSTSRNRTASPVEPVSFVHASSPPPAAITAACSSGTAVTIRTSTASTPPMIGRPGHPVNRARRILLLSLALLAPLRSLELAQGSSEIGSGRLPWVSKRRSAPAGSLGALRVGGAGGGCTGETTPCTGVALASPEVALFRVLYDDIYDAYFDDVSELAAVVRGWVLG